MYSLVSAQLLQGFFVFFLVSQPLKPMCQQQISVTSEDQVLFTLRYPIFTCLTAFLKDDVLENKMQHLLDGVYSFLCDPLHSQSRAFTAKPPSL